MPVRRRQPRQQETGVAERYREAGIAAALSRPWDYPTACGELAALLRYGYADLPKAAQALVASDVLFAFRLLPDVQTGYAVTAANGLLQAVEVALPKQKKAQAASEFKHSVVAHKRRARVQQEPGSPHIPHDVLVHIFSFLDMRSLVAAGLVCWSWNSAANDNNLWKMNYSLFFGVCHWNGTSIPVSGLQNILDVVHNSMDSMSIEFTFYWKEFFHNKYAECATWRFASNRALCGNCRSVIWLSNLTCASPHHCSKNGKDEVKLRALLPDTVAEYILHAEDLAASSSESDDTYSDSEDEYEHRRFWMYNETRLGL
ncbi:F-box protein At5g52880-like [Phragmites australis]|uniref:F-box protein At5g52880-like n=1 Tax=Phragmites australis TaxID=29695 RepID=UPI002D77F4BC|nr:F-box protein At5g52880-like [Phragmites australis]